MEGLTAVTPAARRQEALARGDDTWTYVIEFRLSPPPGVEGAERLRRLFVRRRFVSEAFIDPDNLEGRAVFEFPVSTAEDASIQIIRDICLRMQNHVHHMPNSIARKYGRRKAPPPHKPARFTFTNLPKPAKTSSTKEQFHQPIPELTGQPTPQSVAEAIDFIRSRLDGIDNPFDSSLDGFVDDLVTRMSAESRTVDVQIVAALAQVVLFDAQIGKLNQALDQAVSASRDYGATWTDIGRAAGIRPESALRRWDPTARAKHTKYQRERQQTKAASASSPEDQEL